MSDEAVETLTKALAGAEAGRRVGWAQNFSAQGRLDEALRDQEELRVQRDIMRRAASFLFGFLHAYDQGVVSEALSRWSSSDVEATLDPRVMRAGRESADRLRAQDHKHKERQDERRAAQAAAAKGNKDAFAAGRRQERRLLAERYGFPNEAALLNHLSEYQAAL